MINETLFVQPTKLKNGDSVESWIWRTIDSPEVAVGWRALWTSGSDQDRDIHDRHLVAPNKKENNRTRKLETILLKSTYRTEC